MSMLTHDEVDLLAHGLGEWGGPAHPPSLLRQQLTCSCPHVLLRVVIQPKNASNLD